MGHIARFDLKHLSRRYGATRFVETGTGRGDSLAFASLAGCFHDLYSCELLPALAQAAKRRFASDPKVHIHCKGSTDFLREMCTLIPRTEPVIFWLDAHFPGADYGMAGYGDEKDEAIRTPLAYELGVIADMRPAKLDVVIIDDLRLYARGPFASGPLPDELRTLLGPPPGTRFMREPFDSTHDMHLFWEHEGYVLLTPKDAIQPVITIADKVIADG